MNREEKLNSPINNLFYTKYSLLIYIISLLIVITLSSCSPDEREVRFNEELKAVVYSDKKSIHLKDLTDFEWERVCVITAYLTRKEIRKRLKINSSGVSSPDEGHWKLVFIDKQKKVIQIKIHTLQVVNIGFYIKNSQTCAQRDKAQLIFYEKQFPLAEKIYKRKYASLISN